MEAYEYTFVRHQVLSLTGMDLNRYRGPQLQRHLKTYMMRSGYSNWRAFFRTVSGDPAELGKFKDYVVTNVSSFFQLLICRDAVAHCTVEAKNRLYRRFHDALHPGGVLFGGQRRC